MRIDLVKGYWMTLEAGRVLAGPKQLPTSFKVYLKERSEALFSFKGFWIRSWSRTQTGVPRYSLHVFGVASIVHIYIYTYIRLLFSKAARPLYPLKWPRVQVEGRTQKPVKFPLGYAVFSNCPKYQNTEFLRT